MRAKDNDPACDLTINSTSDHYENRAKREELSVSHSARRHTVVYMMKSYLHRTKVKSAALLWEIKPLIKPLILS